MIQTATTAASVLGVPLVQTTRGEWVENVHSGHAAVVTWDGELIAQVGDASIWTFMRSTAKPIQALPSVLGGVVDTYGLKDEAIALMCASHQGTPAHIAVLEEMLEQTGVREEQLVFGPMLPASQEARDELIRQGGKPRKLYHVCAGKHIGMLALCKLRGWPLETYTQPEHPLQQELLRTIAMIAELAPEEIGSAIDGCGLPVFAMPMWRLALVYARFAAWGSEAAAQLLGESSAAAAGVVGVSAVIATAGGGGVGGADVKVAEAGLAGTRETGVEGSAGAPAVEAVAAAAKRISAAMISYPALVEGSDRLASVMLGDGNVVAKSGAQGVFVFGLRQERLAVVIKLADGGESPWPEAVCGILEQLNLGEALITRIRSQISPEIRNDAGQLVGHRESCLTLTLNA
ncbi:asparaginase [Paenibacillus lignilyticus]|uniref:Asparaginase n=1 Tax=Paenibacillus lignilyticus TaxID=1172615 RepID=A0ABS5CAB4_9BACL|nr:asparaginase [Paenibacillus lignilyticus]MBP3962375.1 asparaginase [Paenibacillus lignilyticus]